MVYDRRIPSASHKTKRFFGGDWKTAELVAAKIKIKLATGDLSFLKDAEPSEAVTLTLKQAVEQYLAERSAFTTLDDYTRNEYERALRLHVYPTLGSRSVAMVRRDDVKAIFERLLKSGKSKSLCRNILAPIRQTYEWLCDEKKLRLENPARRFGKLLRDRGDKKKRVKPLEREDREKLLDAARRDTSRYYFLFLIAIRCGLRLSECFGLKWTDLKPDARTLTIERQLREGRLIDRTKKDKVRTIPISTTVVEALKRHHDLMVTEAERLGRPLSDFVFTTRLGGPIRSKSSFIRKVLQPLVGSAKIKRRVTMQNFRQTFCQDLVDAGHLVEASEWAGHSSVKITGDYYSRGSIRHGAALLDALELGPIGNPLGTQYESGRRARRHK